MDKRQVKRFFEGAVVGGVGISVLMFATGWAVKSSTAEMDARIVARTAVTETLSEICIAQFESASNKDTKFSEMVALESWNRGEFVSEQGWATMPGSDTPSSRVADECALRLAKQKG